MLVDLVRIREGMVNALMSDELFRKILLTVLVIVLPVQAFYLGRASARDEQFIHDLDQLAVKADKNADEAGKVVLQIQELQKQFEVQQKALSEFKVK